MPRFKRIALGLCLSAAVATPGLAACVDYGQFVHATGGVATPELAYDVVVQNSYAYVAVNGSGSFGLRVVDLAAPGTPVVVASINTLQLFAIALDGNHLYVLDRNTGFRVIDVTNPVMPVLLGGSIPQIWTNNEADIATGPGMAYVVNEYGFYAIPILPSGAVRSPGVVDTPGFACATSVYDHWAFVADLAAGLTVIDVINPASPTVVHVVDTPGNALDVALSEDGQVAFVADGATVRLVNVADPAQAVEIGHITPEYSANVVTVSGNILFVGGSWRVVEIFDITNPASPIAMRGTVTRGGASSITTDGAIACVGNWERGITVLDVTNPLPAELAASLATPGSAQDVEVVSSHAYIAAGTAGLSVVDVSAPTAPQLVGSLDTPANALRVEAVGGNLYVADREGDLRIYQLGNPASPTFVRTFDKVGGCLDVAVQGNFAYLVDGFTVVDVSNPANPIERGSVTTLYGSCAVDIIGNHAYVVDSQQGLVVIDVANPDAPSIVTTRPLPGVGLDVQIYENYAYVSDYTSQVHVFDVSNPASPVPAGTIASPYNQPLGFVAAGGVAYVGGANGGLSVYDLSDVTSPSLLGAVYPPKSANNIEVAGEYVYIADGNAGLVIAHIHCDTASDGPDHGGVSAGVMTLLPAWPNPTRGDVTLQYAMPNASQVGLEVFNVAGHRVRRLLQEPVRPGHWTITWDGRDDSGRRVAAGSYVVRLTSAQGRSATRVTLLR